jgi:multiple sugar transport system permease protein
VAHTEAIAPAAAPDIPRGRLGRLREELHQMRSSRLYRRRTLTAYGFMAPSLVILAVFIVWPMIDALRISLYKYSSFGPSEWVGLQNYRDLLSDDAFRTALRNTLYYAAVATPVSVGLALALALLLNSRIPAKGFFRAAIFLPVVISLGVAAIAWTFLIDPNIGLVNYWLGKVGLDMGNGARDPDYAMPAVIAVGVWKNVGFYMVMFLAGLQAIPREFYEAASVDGAGRWRQFRHVTWPLLMNTTMFVFIIAAIAALQAFDQIFVMTRGGPFFSTETLVYAIYRIGFQEFDLGYASAIAWVLTLIVFVLSMIQIRFFSRRTVSY